MAWATNSTPAWQVRFSDDFTSKNMYTAAYVKDGATPVQQVLVSDCLTSNGTTNYKLITP